MRLPGINRRADNRHAELNRGNDVASFMNGDARSFVAHAGLLSFGRSTEPESGSIVGRFGGEQNGLV
jgi:hypothetical protein